MVIPPDETEWALPPEEFAGEIAKRWPDVKLVWVDDERSDNAIDFEIPNQPYALSGW